MTNRTWSEDFIKSFATLTAFKTWNSGKKKPFADADITAAWNEANPPVKPTTSPTPLTPTP